jgi:hypothetical protein
MVSHYRCETEHRLQTARTQRGVDGTYLNGIDYLEVAADPQTLIVQLLHPLAPTADLTEDNVQIIDDQGRPVAVEAVIGVGQQLTIRLDAVHHRAPHYWLQLV